ncbi:hypothetical protein BDK51DRAFT_42476, partial [Blyttiomyces helicus]
MSSALEPRSGLLLNLAAKLYTRPHKNVLKVMAVLSTPGRSIGSFADSAILILISVGIGAFLFWLLPTICGPSYVGMIVFVCVATYLFSMLRIRGPRFFALSVVPILYIFSSIVAATAPPGHFIVAYSYSPGRLLYGAAPPPTNEAGGVPGQYFYPILLQDTVVSLVKPPIYALHPTSNAMLINSFSPINIQYSYLIGLAITWLINVCVFPEFAEVQLKREMAAAIETLQRLLEIVVHDYAVDDTPESIKKRKNVAAELRSHLAKIGRTITEADAEIYYSELIMGEYQRIFVYLKQLAGIVNAICSAIEGRERVYNHAHKSRKALVESLTSELDTISVTVTGTLRAMRRTLLGLGHNPVAVKAPVVDLETGAHPPKRCMQIVIECLRAFEVDGVPDHFSDQIT